MKHAHRLLCLSIFLITGSAVDLPQAGLAHGRRWHGRSCCLRARSGGHAGRVIPPGAAPRCAGTNTGHPDAGPLVGLRSRGGKQLSRVWATLESE
jgi:hypothetical protein